MEKFKVSFTADNQQLKAIGTKHASDTYADIEAEFVLGNRWTDMDSVSAVWWNDFTRIATVLDPQDKCIVPHEVLTRKGCVRVNLVGSVMEGDELVTRLTSYSAEAVQVNEKIKLTGTETSEITPSQFEQFVAMVISEVEKVTGMTAEAVTLPAGSDATAEYSNGVLYLGIPQGIQGETGNGIESVIFNSDYSLTFDFTDGTEFTTPSIRGAEGNGIRSITKTGTSGLVDTYTITFDDGSTTTYTVTNGAKGDKGDTGATPNFSIGTVETLEPTEDATATITGTAENPVLNLGIPQGRTGEVTYEDLESILPRDTASGQIASFPDGQSVVPLHSLKVSLEPIQSGTGTPSPDNVRPISGHTEVVTHRTGKNLFDADLGDENLSPTYGMQKVLDFDVDAFLSFSPKVSNPSLPNNTSFGFVHDPNNVNGGFQWTLSNGSIQTGGRYGKNQTINGTAPAGTICKYVFWYPKDALPTILTQYDIQIELGSTATDYEPYEADTYTTDLGRTVYGGTVDLVTGELMVDRVVDTYNGSEAWVKDEDLTGGIHRFYLRNDTIKKYSDYTNVLLSNKCKATANYQSASTMDGDFAVTAYNITINLFNWAYIFSKTIDTVNGIKAWLADEPLQFCYELATPQTIQLTPTEVRTLLGTNNVWSDGEVTVVYSADTALWIEKRLSD